MCTLQGTTGMSVNLETEPAIARTKIRVPLSSCKLCSRRGAKFYDKYVLHVAYGHGLVYL